MTRIVEELTSRGHHVDVVTALPWYRRHRVEPGWETRVARREATPWGSIVRVNPFAAEDKRNLVRRALGFAAFSVLAVGAGVAAGGGFQRIDGVIAMSPPLTMGVAGRIVAWVRRCPLVFNVQDVFPDAAVATGTVTSPAVVAAASWLERTSYRLADAVTVLSDDLAANVAGKLPVRRRDAVRMIPNFVDIDQIRPGDRMTQYRQELGIGDEPVVLYAGNVGFSQSLELVVAAARQLPDVTFVINGEGSTRSDLVAKSAGLANLRFGRFVPADRLGELLATGDLHVVPLRRGLARASVPSKTYSILAAGRPVLAAIDPGTTVPDILSQSGAGVSIPPDDPEQFIATVASLVADRQRLAAMGRAGRRWVESAASPAAVAIAYEALIGELGARR